MKWNVTDCWRHGAAFQLPKRSRKEAEESVLCLQVTAMGPPREPLQSNPPLCNLFLLDRFWCLPVHAWIPMWYFLCGWPATALYSFLFSGQSDYFRLFPQPCSIPSKNTDIRWRMLIKKVSVCSFTLPPGVSSVRIVTGFLLVCAGFDCWLGQRSFSWPGHDWIILLPGGYKGLLYGC